MKSTLFTISATGLNDSIQEVDVSIIIGQHIIDGNIINDVDVMYPSEIKINNSSGCMLGFVILASDKEKQLMQQRPELFEFIPIPNGFYTLNNFVEKTKYILFKKLDTIQMLKDVTMYCLGYRK